MVRTGRTIRKKVITALVLPPKPEDFAPLIVVGNQKSGNSDCANILAAFRRQLNPSQVSFYFLIFFRGVEAGGWGKKSGALFSFKTLNQSYLLYSYIICINPLIIHINFYNNLYIFIFYDLDIYLFSLKVSIYPSKCIYLSIKMYLFIHLNISIYPLNHIYLSIYNVSILCIY